MSRIRVGIVGVTGYGGQELLKLLLGHPRVAVTYLASSGKSDPAPALRPFGRLPAAVEPFDAARCARACRTAFLCLPHAASMEAAPPLLARGLRLIDFSAAFRLKDARLYDRHYGFGHTEPAWLARAAYGLPELNRSALRRARLVAVPGCYPTGALLALAPLVRAGLLRGRAVIDSKSGVTGAGREARPEHMFAEVNENIKPYGVFTHRHEPEIGQELARAARRRVAFTFTPHLVPMNRGILTTVHVELKRAMAGETLAALLARAYAQEPFVRVLSDGLPDTRGVRGTNFCHLGAAARGRNAVVVSAIDNLGKGAAGGAVQSFNVQHGFPETTGLLTPAGAP